MIEKDTMPRCIVLLAAYNGECWIDEQISSILSQRGVSVDICISVDLSDDRTHQLCLDWEEKDSRIITLPYGERFGGAARNFFRLTNEVDVSPFDMVSFADQDDIWFEDKLHTAWKKLSLDGYDAYSSDVTAFWPDGRQVLIKKSHPQREYDHFFEAAGPGCTYVFKVEAFSAIQVFLSTRYLECVEVALHDWLFYSYCRQSGRSWFIDNNPLMLYRQHAKNQVGTNNNFSAYTKRLKMIRNGWYREQVKKVGYLVAPQLVNKLTNRFFIISHFLELRRRPRDRMFLLGMALIGFF
ncbi:glycosyltransferase [Oceanospirillaceae bacterium]|nr:glycosyltransferase [Oceanospirillaceae bacterium]